MAIKQHYEAFARLLHCASYGYQSGVRKGPFNKIGRFEELGQDKIARVLARCTCIAGYGTASQLSRFQVGRSCDFHRWKTMRSLLRRVEISLHCCFPLAERSAESTWHLPSQSSMAGERGYNAHAHSCLSPHSKSAMSKCIQG